MKVKNVINEKSFYPQKVLSDYGYTQRQLAAELGISFYSIEQTFRRWPLMKTLKRIADHIGANLLEFFTPFSRQELIEKGVINSPMTISYTKPISYKGNKIKRPVIVINKEGSRFWFESVREAAKATDISTRTIGIAIKENTNNKRKFTKGYCFLKG